MKASERLKGIESRYGIFLEADALKEMKWLIARVKRLTKALEFYAHATGSAGLEFPTKGATDENTVEFGTCARKVLEEND